MTLEADLKAAVEAVLDRHGRAGIYVPPSAEPIDWLRLGPYYGRAKELFRFYLLPEKTP